MVVDALRLSMYRFSITKEFSMTFSKRFFCVLFYATLATQAMAEPGQISYVKGTTDPATFVNVESVTPIADRDSNIGLKVYQYGEGDPAMNGNFIGLTITPRNKSIPAYTFDTGINVRDVQKISLNARQNALLLIVNEDVMVYPQTIVLKKRAYRIFYKMDSSGAVSDEIQVVRYRLEK